MMASLELRCHRRDREPAAALAEALAGLAHLEVGPGLYEFQYVVDGQAIMPTFSAGKNGMSLGCFRGFME